MSSSHFDKLPQEMVTELFSNLNLRDVAISSTEDSTSKAAEAYAMFRCARQDRYSIIRYLRNYFVCPIKVTEHMLISDVWISGSTALEFFIPGSRGPYSDIDMYIKDDMDKVYTFMKSMESCGITWMTPSGAVKYKMLSTEPAITLGRKDIPYIQENVDIIMESAEKLLFLAKISEMDKKHYHSIDSCTFTVTTSDNQRKTITVQSRFYDAFKIFTGMLETHGKKTLVQLIVSDVDNIESIYRFSHTAVQCVIAGFGACHLYAYDTYNMISRTWSIPTNNEVLYSSGPGSSAEKYKQRGFTICRADTPDKRYPYKKGYAYRSMNDNDAHFIPMDTNLKGTGYILNTNEWYTLEHISRENFMQNKWVQNGMDISRNFINELNSKDTLFNGCSHLVSILKKNPSSNIPSIMEINDILRDYLEKKDIRKGDDIQKNYLMKSVPAYIEMYGR